MILQVALSSCSSNLPFPTVTSTHPQILTFWVKSPNKRRHLKVRKFDENAFGYQTWNSQMDGESGNCIIFLRSAHLHLDSSRYPQKMVLFFWVSCFEVLFFILIPKIPPQKSCFFFWGGVSKMAHNPAALIPKPQLRLTLLMAGQPTPPLAYLHPPEIRV